MILWLIAFVLMGLMAWIGYQQGAIRSAVSFIGLVLAASLAVPLAKHVYPVVKMFGLQNPLAIQAIAPFVIFIAIWAAFQFIAHAVHQKVELFYKYKNRDDKRRMKFEKLDTELGIPMGLINGTVYFLLFMIPIYVFGYLTVQLGSGNEDPAGLRILNSLRQQMHSTKLDKVVAAYDPAKPEVYQAFDIVGLVYRNPLVENRLSRYPGFLSLGERQEFRTLANDQAFKNLWASGAKVADVLNNPSVKAILSNRELVSQVQERVVPDLPDLRTYLETGKSEKYDEKFLGRWKLNFNETRNRSKSPAIDQRRFNAMLAPYWEAVLVVTPENTAILKRAESTVAQGQSPNMAQGNWKKESGSYELTFDNKRLEVTFEGENKIIVQRDGLSLVFDKQLDRTSA